MIQVTPHIRIYLCTESVDFRKGIDGLVGVCRQLLDKDPFSGSMFVFRNKRRTTLKILIYDGQGFWLFVKRLSHGRFKWWPEKSKAKDNSTSNHTLGLKAGELQLLLWNGDVSRATIGPDWKKVAV